VHVFNEAESLLKDDLKWYDSTTRCAFSALPAPNAFFFFETFVPLATTAGGNLRMTLDRMDNTADNHNLLYRSGTFNALPAQMRFFF